MAAQAEEKLAEGLWVHKWDAEPKTILLYPSLKYIALRVP